MRRKHRSEEGKTHCWGVPVFKMIIVNVVGSHVNHFVNLRSEQYTIKDQVIHG